MNSETTIIIALIIGLLVVAAVFGVADGAMTEATKAITGSKGFLDPLSEGDAGKILGSVFIVLGGLE